MTEVTATRIDLYAPVASFRDPMFPGVSRCLPVPPPSTLRGLLAAATGEVGYSPTLGIAAHADGSGRDLETYHPIASDGSNPAIGGRVAPGKGGATVRQREFLTGVRVTIWVPGADGARVAAAVRRPVWPLRLGRSQDVVHVLDIQPVRLVSAEQARIGHALAPAGAHDLPTASSLKLSETITADRRRTRFGNFLWCPDDQSGTRPVRGALADNGQAVWLLPAMNQPHSGSPLTWILAKSPDSRNQRPPVLLTTHSLDVHGSAHRVVARAGHAGILAAQPRFATWVRASALLHDGGKIATGFQHQLQTGLPWGERHEALSLGFVDALFPDPIERLMIATGVLFHHRPLSPVPGDDTARTLHKYRTCDWQQAFAAGLDRDDPAGARAFLDWFATQLGRPVPTPDGHALWERARDLFQQVAAHWSDVDSDDGLVAVLLQGAVTLADRSASAGVELQTHMPLPPAYLQQLPAPYPHQQQAATVTGHLILRAPTGLGKTEAGLAWASTQLASMPGEPRLVWTLPYRVSIEAMRTRLADDLDPAPGQQHADIGVLHGKIAQSLLARAVEDDPAETGPPGQAGRQAAERAAAEANAARLFTQRIRISTPYQLLRGVVAGPSCSSILLEQANCLLVFDELHAYDAQTFGRLCAAMAFWEKLGSRIAVLSATLAPQLAELISESLNQPVHPHAAAAGIAPDRHRLAIDTEPLTSAPSLQRIRNWLCDEHSVLVIANTVTAAQQVYQLLAPTALDMASGDPDAAILLHSRFKLRDRAQIDRRLLERHPEREPRVPGHRRGGLVVATQAVEVSLCIDLDRGVSEAAPIESVVQRMGRVNRRGRHPDGQVEFRVHAPTDHRPYGRSEMDAAWEILTQHREDTLNEETLTRWLADAYETDWGQQWLADARDARDTFAAGFLDFSEPFEDRSGHATALEEDFDTIEVLLEADYQEYRSLVGSPDGHALLAAGLLIPLKYTQFAGLKATGHGRVDPATRLPLVSGLPYDPATGLELPSQHGTSPPPETVL